MYISLRYIPRRIEPRSSNRNLYTNVHTALFTRAKRRKQVKCSSNDECVLEMIILSEVSQTEKDKYHMISHRCGI